MKAIILGNLPPDHPVYSNGGIVLFPKKRKQTTEADNADGKEMQDEASADGIIEENSDETDDQ